MDSPSKLAQVSAVLGAGGVSGGDRRRESGYYRLSVAPVPTLFAHLRQHPVTPAPTVPATPLQPPYSLSDGVQQPFGGGSGPADPHAVAVAEPGGIDVGGGADAEGAWVHALAKVEEDLAVGARFPGDEKDYVVRPGEVHQVLVPVRHLRADGIVDRHAGAEGAHAVADFRVFGRAFGGLGEDFHGLGEIDLPEAVLQHRAVFHDDGVAIDLAQQAEDLGVTDFSEDEQSAVHTVLVQAGVRFTDVVLEL